MAPRGGKKNTGLRREDAARDRMKEYGFEKCVIDQSIKEVLEVYGEDQWFLIEDANYAALLSVCLEKQEEQAKQMAAEEHDQTGQEEQEEEKEADTEVMDSSDYEHNPVGGAESSHRGKLSSEDEETDPDEESDPDEDSDDDDDYDSDDSDEIIQLTPEPLCEELKAILRESRRR